MDDTAFLFVQEHCQATKDFSKGQCCVGVALPVFLNFFLKINIFPFSVVKSITLPTVSYSLFRFF